MTTPALTPWDVASTFQTQQIDTLAKYKVELDRDPTQNVGRLHEKIATVREYSNEVRDVLFRAQTMMRALGREAAAAGEAYNKRIADLGRSKVDDETYKKMKSKDERELYLRAECADIYERHRVAEERVEEWDGFIKQINTIYYSLSNTRDDINAQINVLKQQIFKGDIKPGEELRELSGLPLLNELLSSETHVPQIPATPALVPASVAPASPDGSVPWV